MSELALDQRNLESETNTDSSQETQNSKTSKTRHARYCALLNSDVGDKLIYFMVFQQIHPFKLDF